MTTKINVDLDRTIGTLDRRVYGGFVEHLGRCIYGGLYEPGSPVSDSQGFRRDTFDLLKALQLSVLRWPGGNFVSNYHWRDGVGPRTERPTRTDLAWGGLESNHFGTDEYITYCRELGAEPYICLNMGSGTLEEALAWVEYCNGTRETAWADMRRHNGYSEPHDVKWWGLGNEIYGDWQVGALSAEEYVAEATRWARAIRMVDPKVRLVSCGELGWTDWDRKVIEGVVHLVDLHSLHIYTGSDEYWTNVLSPHATERAIDIAAGMLARAAYNARLARAPKIVYDEWNVWYREMTGSLEERYVFSDALAVGTYLNIFVRRSAWVKMANLAQMVNAIAPIVTTAESAVVQPIYYPFLLHSTGHLEMAVDTFVAGPTVEGPRELVSRWPHRIDDLGPFHLVDVAATSSRDRSRVALTLVNRSDREERVEVMLRNRNFDGAVSMKVATASSAPAAVAGIESVEVRTGEEEGKGQVYVAQLPGSSFSLLEASTAPF